MDETKISNPSPEKPTDKDYKKKRVEEIGSALAQIKARVKANRSCVRKDDDSKTSTREILSEKSEKYIQVLELDKAKAQKLEKERPKIKEAIENLMIDRENQKLVEKKIEETRAKQAAPLPEIPVEVQKRISDLEITIHNLKETLSEKERVLNSKTESWRLLNDQLEQRNMEVVDRYEMMAKEIDAVKTSYAEQEVFLKNELEKCKSKLQDADSLLISQENWKQEQEEGKAEFETLKLTHSGCENKIGEFQRSLEAEKELCLKLKTQIKKYRNQVNSKKDLTAEIERLQNHIATLEEEKEAASNNQERADQLESRLKTVEVDLTSSREQCNRVNDDYKDLCTKLTEKEEIIKTLNEALEKMEQSKISSEFKAVELEEKLEAENREDRTQSDKMCKEIDNLKRHVKQQEEMVDELRKLIVQKEEEIKAIKESREMEYSFGYDTQDLKDLLEEWKSKYSKIEENVRIVEEDKETLLVKVENLQIELNSVNEKCQNLVTELSEKEQVVNNYAKKNSELIESLSKSAERVAELEKELNCDKKPGLKNEEQTQKMKKLAANLKIKVKLCKELEEKVIKLNEKLTQQESSITLLTNEKTDLENIVTEYKMKLENVSLDTDVVDQLRNLLSEKELVIQQLSQQEGRAFEVVEKLQRARTESYNELVERDSTIKHLKEENLLLESKLNENLIEIHSVDDPEKKETENDQKIKIDFERDTLLQQVDSSLSQIKNLTDELEMKVKIIQDLENTVSELNSQLESANLLQNETKLKLDEELKIMEELKKELSTLKSSQDLMNSDLSDRTDLIEQLKILQTELESSKKIISNKEEIITTFETQISSLKSEMNQNESQLVKMQEMYVEESTHNEGVITNIQMLESELNLSKYEIVSLSNQLGEVSSNYDQCMESLKEKDNYIDRLEKDLTLTTDKIKYLEFSMDERHKAMEERTKHLGEKLNEASSIGLNFEHYQAEMEQKMNKFDETEKLLVSKINELVQLNSALEGELNDIKSAYNMTLDQIELLNKELNQVMAQIEHRNKELVRIGDERNSLIDRLNELEDTCTNLRGRLQQHEEESESLKSELDNKLKELDVAAAEITNLQTQLGSNQLTDSCDLNKELEVLKTDYEDRLRELQIEKDDLLKVIKGSVELEVDSLMKAAEDKVEKKEEIKLFSWEGHTENTAFEEMQEDNWGWNASEAKLEEEYQNSEANKMKQFEEEKEKLKGDNQRLEEEMKSLKIKCTKLVAKVKELKSTLEKSKNKTGFEDLDFAMQEELRSQVDDINKKNKDLQSEILSMKTEKERLTKRVETLTSANNQLIEMKERQDIEVQVWQRNCAELKNQLQSFDWNEAEAKKETKPVSNEPGAKPNSQLEDKLSFLETENEELLQIICSLNDEKKANSNLAIELKSLKEENQKLKDNKEVSSNEITIEINELKKLLENERLEVQNKLTFIEQLNQEKNSLESTLETMKKELETSQSNLGTLMNQMNDSSLNNEHIKTEYNTVKVDLETKNQQILSLNDTISSLQENLNRLNEENALLKESGNEKDIELTKLSDELSQLALAVKHIEGLQSEQLQLSNEIDRLKAVVESLSVDNENLRTSCNTKVAEMDLLKADMVMTQASKDAAINELQNLRDELIRGKTEEIVDASNKLEAPPASCMFGDDSPSPVFTMPSIFTSNEPVVQSSSISNNSTIPLDIPSENMSKDQSSHCYAESPPVFRGFFSNQIDSFTSAIQQHFDIQPQEKTHISQDVLDSSSQNNQENLVDPKQLLALQEKILKLEEENFNLTQKMNDVVSKTNYNDLKTKLTEKEREICNLQNQIQRLNEEIKINFENFDVVKIELLKTNQESVTKMTEFQNVIDSCSHEIAQLKTKLSEAHQQVNEMEIIKHNEEMRRHQEIESERLKANDIQTLKERMDEQLRQNERNFQNILLNKDEEKNHLVSEISTKQAQHQQQIEVFNSQLCFLENELKSAKDLNETRSAEIASLKQELNRVNLQQSVTATENCNQLSEQIASLQEELRKAHESYEVLLGYYNSSETTNKETVAELYVSLEIANGKIKDFDATVAALTQEINELRARLEQEKFSNESVRSKDADQTRLLSSEVELLQSSITEKDLEIERLSKLLTGLQEKLVKVEESKISDEVSRLSIKLDQALYTLHLRDVRCDELTVEIMQLLEERDALQLRLSEVLRNNESLRISSTNSNSPDSEPPPSLPESKSSHNLNNKIGELHTGYMKDPAVRVDRENRYSQQMHLFTSSESNAPVEPAVKQDEPSSDFGILNWFFNSSSSPQPTQEPAT